MTLPAPYYADEAVTLYHGDSRALAALVEQPDHVVTDPPYSEDVEAGARTLTNGARASGSHEAGSALVPFSISVDDVRGVLAAARAKRWTVATVDWQHLLPLKQEPPAGHRFVRAGVWNKTNGAPQLNGLCPAQGWEAVAILHSSSCGMRWNGGGSRAVWTTEVERASRIGHPTPKPLPLMRELVRLFTDPGDVILDPFAGSGTTGLAARIEGRRAILIEREERYCEVIAKRLAHMPAESPRALPLFGGAL